MTPELEFRAGFVANSRMVQDLSFNGLKFMWSQCLVLLRGLYV